MYKRQFKYGAPADAGLLFDVRCLPNPYYVLELKDKTGLDSEVYDYVSVSYTHLDVYKRQE